jgi:hypothetical protein
VFFNGEPVARAGVLFSHAGARPAGATTDDAGVFLLRTCYDGDGTPAGEHTVCISKFVPLNGKDAGAYAEMQNTLPERYASPVTSPLRAIVRPGGNNRFRFDLEP